MGTLKKLLLNNVRQYGMFIALIVVTLIFQKLTLDSGIEHGILKPDNISNIIQQNSYVFILSLGMLLVIVAFHIDLSVGSIVGFVGAVCAILTVDMKVPFALAVLVSLIVGALIGAWHGLWIAYLRIPAFIVTLGGQLIFSGLTIAVLDGRTVGPVPTTFGNLINGYIPDFFPGNGLHMTTMVIGVILSLIFVILEFKNRITMKKYKFEVLPFFFFFIKLLFIIAAINAITYQLAIYQGIPNVLLIVFILVVFYSFITNKTIAGRHIYALGGNEKAAQLSGVKTKRVVFWVFVNMGVLSALAGLVILGRFSGAAPSAGIGFELDTIASCFIGGASTAGGVGTIIGAIIGGLFMGILNNGMGLLNVSVDWQKTIKGIVLLLAVCFDLISKSKASK
jgi:putative multiple sugar transport system permease protein